MGFEKRDQRNETSFHDDDGVSLRGYARSLAKLNKIQTQTQKTCFAGKSLEVFGQETGLEAQSLWGLLPPHTSETTAFSKSHQ
jgi:hypothetical protein